MFICNKCRTCGKFPFCNVTESLDGKCGTYEPKALGTFIDKKLSKIRQNEINNKIKEEGN